MILQLQAAVSIAWNANGRNWSEKGKLVFADTTINPLSIVKLVQEDSDTYQFEGTSTLITNHQLDSFEDRTRFLEELIIKLTNSSESVSV